MDGKGACPPEDCGGAYGYGMMKEVFATTPESEEADEYREWLVLEENEVLDPHTFSDIDTVNSRLKKI